MKTATKATTFLTIVSIAGCSLATSSPPANLPDEVPRDGTLRIGVPSDFPVNSLLAKSQPDDSGDPQAAIDPQGDAFYDSWELLRCCLARTLLSYEGKPTDQGGTTLRPDLAAAMPDVSADGLVWTFTLRQGIHYAPPLDDVEIVSDDFVRAMQRLLPKVAAPFRPQIEGLAEYVAGETTVISGLETPDDHTLRIVLTKPQGDLPARLAYPDMAPVPAHPSDPAAPLGVATGHDHDYGRFLVASGPYMVEGAEVIDFTAPLDQQQPAPGFLPGRSLTLVRNPSWDPATDALRPAHAKRIEITIGGTREALAASVDSGVLDLVFYAGPPPVSPVEQIERYRADPTLGSVHADPRDFLRYVGMNLAQPPFDDIHVRKAVNLVIDKAQLIELSGGPWTGEVAGHIVLNSLQDNLLLTYDPYATPGSAGDVAAAGEEMKLSRYDTDGDGACDAAACDGVQGIAPVVWGAHAEAVVADLEQIGIKANLEVLDPGAAFAQWFDPAGHAAFMVGLGYGKDHLGASTFFTSNFDSRTSLSEETTNGTLIGASVDQLAAWGYPPLQMPIVDDRIDLCHAKIGSSQVQCWAELDQYLMENVVPWVPFTFERHTRVVSSRVVRYSFDQSIALPALDQIAVPPGS